MFSVYSHLGVPHPGLVRYCVAKVGTLCQGRYPLARVGTPTTVGTPWPK